MEERTQRLQPLDQQQTVDEEGSGWVEIWQAGVTNPLPKWPQDLGAGLQVQTTDDFREACYTFPAATGLGWDKFHPRALARCSDATLSLFIMLLAMAERMGRWHSLIGVVMVVLLPKSDGGRRPIGLFPSIIRI